jgi:hypothetical protein
MTVLRKCSTKRGIAAGAEENSGVCVRLWEVLPRGAHRALGTPGSGILSHIYSPLRAVLFTSQVRSVLFILPRYRFSVTTCRTTRDVTDGKTVSYS